MFALNQNFLKRIFLFVAILGVGFSSYSQISQRPQDSCPSGQQQIGKLDSSTAICAGNSKIQVGAFGDFNNAKNFVNKMRSQGFDSALDPGIEGQLNKILISVNGKTGFSDDSAKTIGSRLAQAGIKYSVVIDRGSNNSSSGGGQRLQEANSQITQRPQNSNATPGWSQLYKGKERVNQPGWAEGYCNQTMLYRLTQRKDSRWMDVEKFSKVVENNKGVRSKVLPGITNCDKRFGGNYSNVSFEACMINEERLSQYQFGFMVGWLEASQFLNGPQDPAQLPNHERASAGCMSLLP